jgi:hypothetical protein
MERILNLKDNRESFKDYKTIIKGIDLGTTEPAASIDKKNARRHLRKVYGQYFNHDQIVLKNLGKQHSQSPSSLDVRREAEPI